MSSPQLLILGNGFDKHCGLASTYKDFFRSTILDTVGEQFGLKQLQAGVSGFWEKLLVEYYKTYGEDNYRWCDIERIIKEALFSIFIQKSYGGTELWEIAQANARYNREPYEIISDIRSYPIDSFLLKYCMEFYRQSAIKSNEDLKQKLFTHLLQQLNNLEKRFCKYLKYQLVNPNNEKELNTDYIVNAVNVLGRLTGFSASTYNNINNIIHQEYGEIVEKTGPNRSVTRWTNVNVLAKEFSKLKYTNILSFNYTALFDILSVGSPCAYSNVHGKLCKAYCTGECDYSNIIFGIDDNLIQTQSETSALRIFSKTYRKMLQPNNPLSILPPKNNTSIEIKFYGHSLSDADYSYFQSIFDYYELYGNSKVNLIFYYSKGYEQHDAIYRLISEYGKSLTNKEQGKNLIHKLLLENRLQIQEIKE